MSLITRKILFEYVTPAFQPKRFRGKINIQKPRQPHYEKAKYLQLTKPLLPSKYWGKSSIELCTKGVNFYPEKNMDNPYERIIARELYQHITQSKLIAFYHINAMNARDRFKAFAAFKKQDMLFKQYGKKTLKIAVEGTPYETILDFYVSQNVMVFSPEANAKKVLQITKRIPQIILLAAILEGRFISKDEFVKYSTIPDLQTAQVGLVQTLNSTGSQLVSHLNTHQTTLVSQLDERIKQLKEDDKE